MRRPGYYWVRQFINDNWEIAEYCDYGDQKGWKFFDRSWRLRGDKACWEIDERIIIREPQYKADNYNDFVNDIAELISNEDDFMQKFENDYKIQELISKAIMIKAIQIASIQSNIQVETTKPDNVE